MNTLKRALFALAILLIAPSALAQQEDPTVNESDFDTNPPPADESYLDDANNTGSSDPTVTENDFDTSVPTPDESYLDDTDGTDATPNTDSKRGTPGPGLLLGLTVLALAGLALRRK